MLKYFTVCNIQLYWYCHTYVPIYSNTDLSFVLVAVICWLDPRPGPEMSKPNPPARLPSHSHSCMNSIFSARYYCQWPTCTSEKVEARDVAFQ